MKGTTVRIDMKHVQEILAARGLADKGPIQKALTNEVYKHSDKYTPFRQGGGGLKSNVEVSADRIKYNSIYARYQWFGKVMVGSAPKTVTDKDLVYNGAPTRGKMWAIRMWADKGKEIVKGLAKMAGGRAK